MTEQAKVVIIGGGIVGSAIAYHLVKFGWKDIMLLDKGALPENDGSSSHAPGGVGAINHSKLMTQFAQYASKLYSELPDYPHQSSIYSKLTDSDITRKVYNAVGGIELARSQERWEDMKRLHSAAQSFGVETELMNPKQIQEIWPIINPEAFTGGLLIPSSSLVSGMGASGAMAAEAVRMGGCTIHEHTGVVDVDIKNNHVTAVLTDNPNMPRIECEHIVMATNIWGPILGDKLGLKLPLMAFEHQYLVSEPVDELSHFDPSNRDHEAVYPLIRDLDVTMYYRNHWNRLGVGSYYHKPIPVDPYAVGKTAMREYTPEDYVEARKLANEMMPCYTGKSHDTEFN
ncbi:MAG: FAD-dependent oxidoreductase, partial [Chloroflexota bacterium]